MILNTENEVERDIIRDIYFMYLSRTKTQEDIQKYLNEKYGLDVPLSAVRELLQNMGFVHTILRKNCPVIIIPDEFRK